MLHSRNERKTLPFVFRPSAGAARRDSLASTSPPGGFPRSLCSRLRSAHLGAASGPRPLRESGLRGLLSRGHGLRRGADRTRLSKRESHRVVAISRLRPRQKRDRNRLHLPVEVSLGRRLQLGNEAANARSRVPFRRERRLSRRSAESALAEGHGENRRSSSRRENESDGPKQSRVPDHPPILCPAGITDRRSGFSSAQDQDEVRGLLTRRRPKRD